MLDDSSYTSYIIYHTSYTIIHIIHQHHSASYKSRTYEGRVIVEVMNTIVMIEAEVVATSSNSSSSIIIMVCIMIMKE